MVGVLPGHRPMSKQPSDKRAAGGHSVPVEAQLGPLTYVKEQATERADLDTALARIPEADAFVDRQLKRIEPFFDLEPPGARARRGRGTGRLADRAGQARLRGRRRRALGAGDRGQPRSRRARPGCELRHQARRGRVDARSRTSSIDFVNAYSVLEHVDDPDQVFREVYRVLRRPGAFFFSTTSALSPLPGRDRRLPAVPLVPAAPSAAHHGLGDRESTGAGRQHHPPGDPLVQAPQGARVAARGRLRRGRRPLAAAPAASATAGAVG